MAEVQTFEQIYGLTRGGPASATKTLALLRLRALLPAAALRLRLGGQHGLATRDHPYRRHFRLALVSFPGDLMTPSKQKRFTWQNVFLYGLLLLVLLGLVFPVVFMAFTSFKTAGEVNRIPPTLWPRYPTLENYPFMAEAWDFWLALRNSVFLAGGSGLAATLLGAMAAYAFSRGTFRGKTLMYSLLVASMARPGHGHSGTYLYRLFATQSARHTYWIDSRIHSRWRVTGGIAPVRLF